jgi:hypothetical protein
VADGHEGTRGQGDTGTRDACKCTRGDELARGHVGKGEIQIEGTRGHGDTGTRGARVKLARGRVGTWARWQGEVEVALGGFYSRIIL